MPAGIRTTAAGFPWNGVFEKESIWKNGTVLWILEVEKNARPIDRRKVVEVTKLMPSYARTSVSVQYEQSRALVF